MSTKTMLFPRKVKFIQKDGSIVEFDKGVQEVPEELVDHWYLEANGVIDYDRNSRWDMKQPEVAGRKADKDVVLFLRARDYDMKTVEGAQKFIEGLAPDVVRGFWMDYDHWFVEQASTPATQEPPPHYKGGIGEPPAEVPPIPEVPQIPEVAQGPEVVAADVQEAPKAKGKKA